MFGIFDSHKGGYINHLNAITGFNTLRDDSAMFLLFLYKPKCDKCLEKHVEIAQYLERSKATNLYQVDIVNYPELKDFIAKQVSVKVK